METVLTAVVSRLLKKFIRTTDGGESGGGAPGEDRQKQKEDLRVRLTNGKVVLHNLDLDLNAIGLSTSGEHGDDGARPLVTVERAFAKELSVSIPWTALSTKAIEICLDTVEVVLDVNEDAGPREDSGGRASTTGEDRRGGGDVAPGDLDGEASNAPRESERGGERDGIEGENGDSSEGKRDQGWLSSLFDTLGDTSVRIRNLVLKLRCDGTVATIMCGELKLFTSFEDEASQGPNPLDPRYFFSKWVCATTIMVHVQCDSRPETWDPIVNVTVLKAHLSLPSPFTLTRSSVENLRGLHDQYERAMDPQVKVYLDDVALNLSPDLGGPLATFLRVLRARGSPSEAEAGAEVEGDHEGHCAQDGEVDDVDDVQGDGGEVGAPSMEEEVGQVPTKDAPSPLASPLASPTKRESRSWLSFGSSVASKTWDFIVAGEDEEMDWEGYELKPKEMTEEENQMQKEVEEKMSKLWTKFNITISVKRVGLGLATAKGSEGQTTSSSKEAEIILTLEDLSSGLWYEEGEVGRISAAIGKATVEHCGSGEMGAVMGRQSIFSCTAPPHGERFSGTALSVTCTKETEGGHSPGKVGSVLSILVGETWALYHQGFLRHAREIWAQMKEVLAQDQAQDQAPTETWETGSQRTDHGGDGEEDEEEEDGGGGVRVEVEMATTTLSCASEGSHAMVAQVGLLIENLKCAALVGGPGPPSSRSLEVDLAAQAYLVHLKRLSEDRYIRNFLSRAATLRGGVAHADEATQVDLRLEDFECCLDGKRYQDLLESLYCKEDAALVSEVTRAMTGVYANVSGATLALERTASEWRASATIGSGLLGLFVSDFGGARAFLGRVVGVEGRASGGNRTINVTSVVACLCRDENVGCDARLKSFFSSDKVERNVVVQPAQCSLGAGLVSIDVGEVLAHLSFKDVKSLVRFCGFAGRCLLPDGEVAPFEGTISVRMDSVLLNLRHHRVCDQALSVALSSVLLSKSVTMPGDISGESGATRAKGVETTTAALALGSLGVTHTCEEEEKRVLCFDRDGCAEEACDISLTSVSTLAHATRSAEKQVTVRADNPFTCSVSEDLLTMVIDILTTVSTPAPASGVPDAREGKETSQVTNTCVKVSLKVFSLNFEGFHHQALRGERLCLRSSALILALYPSLETSAEKRTSEIDVCTLSFQISVVGAAPSTEGGLEEFVFLGPADVHWKWQSLESLVLSIDAGNLPLRLYWAVHRIIPSAFYGLFRVLWSGWEALKAQRPPPREGSKAAARTEAPFLAVLLQGSEMHFDIQARVDPPSFVGRATQGIGSLVKVVTRAFKLGFHFWTSSNYLFTFVGQCEMRHDNPACFTEETFLLEIPVKASLGFNYQDTHGEGTVLPIAKTLDATGTGVPGLLKVRNTCRGSCLEVCAEDRVHLLATKSVLNKVTAIEAQLGATQNIVLWNHTQLPLACAQAGSGGTAAKLKGEASCKFAWPRPAVMVPGMREAIRIRVDKEDCGWSETLSLSSEACRVILLPVSDAHEVDLVVQVARIRGDLQVHIRPRHCIINSTQIHLYITCEGCLGGCRGVLDPALDTKSFSLGPARGGAGEISRQDLLALRPRGGEGGSQAALLRMRSQDGLVQWDRVRFLDNHSTTVAQAHLEGDPPSAEKTAGKTLFCEFLTSHLNTGQVLIRVHPTLYITNGLSGAIHTRSALGDLVAIPRGATAPLFPGVDLGAVFLSAQGRGGGGPPMETTCDCRGRVGWFQVDLKPKPDAEADADAGALPLKCLCHLETMHEGALKFMRVFPEVSLQNCTGVPLSLAFESPRKPAPKPAPWGPSIKVAPGSTLHTFPNSDRQVWLLRVSLRDHGGPGEASCLVDLSDLQYSNQGSQRHFHAQRVTFEGSGARLYLTSARTALAEGADDPGAAIFQIGVFPLFSLVNLCRGGLRLRLGCARTQAQVKSTCESGGMVGLVEVEAKEEEEEAGVSLEMQWAEEEGSGSWSDPVEIRAEAGFALSGIPLVGAEGRGALCEVPVSSYTFSYEGRFVTLVSEEDHPPFVFENASGGPLEVWMTNREGGTIDMAEAGEILVLPVGTVSKDLGAHFAHLCVATKRERSGGSGPQETGQEEDVFNTEVDTILSLVNKVAKETKITVFFRPTTPQGAPPQEWASRVLGEEEPTNASPDPGRVAVSSTFHAPTWSVVFSRGSSGGSEAGEAERRARSVSIDLRCLQVTLLDLEEGGPRHQCQVLLNHLSLDLKRYNGDPGVEEMVYEAQVSWSALQACISQPPRPVLWTASSREDRSGLRGLVSIRGSALPSPAEGVRGRLVNLRVVEVRLARMNARIDDAVLVFFSVLQRKFSANSALLPLESFLLSGGGEGPGEAESPQEAAARHIKGIFAPSEGGGSRIHLERVVIREVLIVCTFKSSGKVAIFPYTLDVCNSPIALHPMCLEGIYTNTKFLAHTVGAYYLAEGIANAPQIVGSLGLLFNPMGIVQSVRRGVHDLIGLPLAGLKQGNPLNFVGGLGLGGLRFLGHVSGSLLSSVSVFSSASASMLQSTIGPVASPLGGALQLIGDFTQGILDTTGFTDLPENLPEACAAAPVLGSAYRYLGLAAEAGEAYVAHFHLRWGEVARRGGGGEAMAPPAVLVVTSASFFLLGSGGARGVAGAAPRSAAVVSSQGRVRITAGEGDGQVALHAAMDEYQFARFCTTIILL